MPDAESNTGVGQVRRLKVVVAGSDPAPDSAATLLCVHSIPRRYLGYLSPRARQAQRTQRNHLETNRSRYEATAS